LANSDPYVREWITRQKNKGQRMLRWIGTNALQNLKPRKE
jgi:hypothetical protein